MNNRLHACPTIGIIIANAVYNVKWVDSIIFFSSFYLKKILVMSMTSLFINFNWPTVNNMSPVYNFKIKNWIMYYLLTKYAWLRFTCFFNFMCKLGDKNSKSPKGTHEVMITSFLRWNDVTTLFWRSIDVIIKPCVRWDTCMHYICSGHGQPWWSTNLTLVTGHLYFKRPTWIHL